MKKRILVGLPLGCLGSFLSSSIGIPLVLIALCISLIPHIGEAHSNPGPGTNNTNTTGQTQPFTGHTNGAVVNAARTLVSFLYSCGGFYRCYTGNFPVNVLHYLEDACGNSQCPYVQSGNFQCVFFVLGVYWLAGQTLPAGPNAVDFWTVYQGYSGWLEIPANGTPEPGDIAVFSGPVRGPNRNPFGHVAVIIDVSLANTGGYIQLAQANGLQAIENLPLVKTSPDHSIWHVTAWPGYNLLGYIRNATYG